MSWLETMIAKYGSEEAVTKEMARRAKLSKGYDRSKRPFSKDNKLASKAGKKAKAEDRGFSNPATVRKAVNARNALDGVKLTYEDENSRKAGVRL